MEYLVIAVFSLVLFITMLLKVHLFYALLVGYMLFFAYGLYKGCTAKELVTQSLENTKKLGTLLTLFFMIGVLTATWRASGTIAYLVVESAALLIPSLFLFSTFVLCAFISLLTGTSFGTSATMGLICMTMGNMLHINMAYLGGAILSGSYFGDRMSPMSSSAHLVAKLTGTDIFVNMKNMLSSCLLPCLCAGALYIFLGRESGAQDIPHSTLILFAENFVLSWHTAIPAILMIILALFKVNAKIIMLASIISASAVCLFLQKMSLGQLFYLYWAGFESSHSTLNAILGGGGLQSMLTVMGIVALSSSYVGLFQASNIFHRLYTHIAHLAQKISPFGSTALVSLLTCMMTCNQTLSIFMTKSLCEKQYAHKENLAHAIENSAVLMAGLIPWNIACSVVLANVGAPVSSIFYAFFLYLVPIISFFIFKNKQL